MARDSGGGDLTFADHSEGGFWVEPNGFKVTVTCPTRKAMQEVVALLSNISHFHTKEEPRGRRSS